jgi:hypothetical protein
MFGLLLVAAPLALIMAIGAAVWLEGHIVDQPVDSLVPAREANDATSASASGS